MEHGRNELAEAVQLDVHGIEPIRAEDRTSTVISHPTNIALKGNRMFTSNLGRWHITEIDLSGLAD